LVDVVFSLNNFSWMASMNMIESVHSVISNYANFNDRASRSEFWWWKLLFFGIYILSVIVSRKIVLLEILLIVISLAIFIPNLAVDVRRLHDTDRSGWWILLMFVPVIGLIVLLVFWSQKGTAGSNRFGADPLDYYY
jgi:uncharacterized membrane protein YhaH (DUF805 family)